MHACFYSKAFFTCRMSSYFRFSVFFPEESVKACCWNESGHRRGIGDFCIFIFACWWEARGAKFSYTVVMPWCRFCAGADALFDRRRGEGWGVKSRDNTTTNHKQSERGRRSKVCCKTLKEQCLYAHWYRYYWYVRKKRNALISNNERATPNGYIYYLKPPVFAFRRVHLVISWFTDLLLGAFILNMLSYIC